MDDVAELVTGKRPKVNWKRLLITLAVGAVPATIFFLFAFANQEKNSFQVLWWLGTLSLLATLFVACFAFVPKLYPMIFTLFAVFALSWISGSLLEGRLPAEWDLSQGWRSAIVAVAGLLIGVAVPVAFWFSVFFVTTQWLLAISESFDVPWWTAFRFVAARTFDVSQFYWVVENGAVTVDTSKGLLAKLGGPGALVVRPGNAVALERGGKTSRIVGPGVYPVKRLELIKKPVEVKGVIDLRPQFLRDTALQVLTKDGIPLNVEASVSFQIEPKSVTDKRPSSLFEGGEATSKVLGEPEYPVYEATIQKAVFATTAGGWKGLFPWGAYARLYDVVGAYTLDQIFPGDPVTNPDPDARVIRAIEEKVLKLFDPTWAGVQLRGFDILRVTKPDDVEKRMIKKWTSPVDRDLKVEEARAERDAIIERSQGQARALYRLEKVKAGARQDMVDTVERLLDALTQAGQPQLALNFVSVIQELTKHVGEDEAVTMRYIEAMQAIVQSEGTKSFLIMPPTPTTSFLPTPPTPVEEAKKAEEKKG